MSFRVDDVPGLDQFPRVHTASPAAGGPVPWRAPVPWFAALLLVALCLLAVGACSRDREIPAQLKGYEDMVVMQPRPGRIRRTFKVDVPHPRERADARLKTVVEAVHAEIVGVTGN